jgi:glycosyltransferase involved in cell wall biosynthesis
VSIVTDREESPSRDPATPPAVSVVIATRNRSAYWDELMAALATQDLGARQFEVVIVDDASSDDTWATLKAALPKGPLSVLALRLGTRAGQGQARNVGIAAARGDIVAFTDDDCVPDPRWLSVLTEPFFRPGSTIVQGRTIPWEHDRAQGGPWARTVWVLGETWLFETCNIAYRRRDLVEVGGFPGAGGSPATADGKAVGEDAILGWRVVEAGASLRFNPEALVYHRNEPTSYVQWLRAHAGRAVFPDLVRRSPFGRRALWHGLFLARRSAAFDLALVCLGVGLVRRRTMWLAGMLPWAWMALPEAADRGGRNPLFRLAQLGAGDLLGLSALLVSSVRHRSLVL